MFWNLLSSVNSSDTGAKGGGLSPVVLLLIMVVLFALMMVWSRRTQKKREQEINEKLDAIQPGDKVMTIGYLCGTVVEVCAEENTVVIETGSEKAGKSYVKIDRRAIYQTNPATAPVEEVSSGDDFVEETEEAEETPFENTEE